MYWCAVKTLKLYLNYKARHLLVCKNYTKVYTKYLYPAILCLATIFCLTCWWLCIQHSLKAHVKVLVYIFNQNTADRNNFLIVYKRQIDDIPIVIMINNNNNNNTLFYTCLTILSVNSLYFMISTQDVNTLSDMLRVDLLSRYNIERFTINYTIV